MITIRHPRPQDGRQTVFGVEFIDGVASVESLHPERELALRQHGHTIEEDGKPFFDLTVPELRELAAIEGIDLPKRATKPEIVSAFGRAYQEKD